MRFILGCIVTLVILAVIGIVCVDFGLISFRADQSPSAFETKYAMKAVDASTHRNAADLKNPYQPTDQNLLEGMRDYRSHCAGCSSRFLNRLDSAFSVVSLPAASMPLQKPRISSSLRRLPPSTSAWQSVEIRSAPGRTRRSAMMGNR